MFYNLLNWFFPQQELKLYDTQTGRVIDTVNMNKFNNGVPLILQMLTPPINNNAANLGVQRVDTTDPPIVGLLQPNIFRPYSQIAPTTLAALQQGERLVYDPEQNVVYSTSPLLYIGGSALSESSAELNIDSTEQS
jgi:hypothetical protein